MVSGVGTPTVVAASEAGGCGFVADDVTLSPDGVSVIMDAGPRRGPPPRWLARRARLLGIAARGAEFCPKSDRYVRAILERLTRATGLERLHRLEPPLEVVFQCDDDVPLPVARAMAGNVLLVPRALPLLSGSEDAVAAVLAHELAHFSLQHARRLEQTGVLTARSGAARDIVRTHESEADITGLRILARAGYDPVAAIDHLQVVSAMYKARQPRAAAPLRHDDDGVRSARLRSQIEACGYRFSGHRTPIPAAIPAELARP